MLRNKVNPHASRLGQLLDVLTVTSITVYQNRKQVWIYKNTFHLFRIIYDSTTKYLAFNIGKIGKQLTG